jgi:hypothetical protein
MGRASLVSGYPTFSLVSFSARTIPLRLSSMFSFFLLLPSGGRPGRGAKAKQGAGREPTQREAEAKAVGWPPRSRSEGEAGRWSRAGRLSIERISDQGDYKKSPEIRKKTKILVILLSGCSPPDPPHLRLSARAIRGGSEDRLD